MARRKGEAVIENERKEINEDSGTIDFNSILEKMNNELESMYKDVASLSLSDDGEEKHLFKTGNPYLDLVLCGGIPKNRMTYLWGVPGSGKTTLSFQIASSIFRQSVLNGEQDRYIFLFLDSEEGVATEWLKRIKIVLPFQKPIIPNTIEDIPAILDIVKKKFPQKELVVIWDSVAATPPKMVTGRGDTARAVSSMLRDLQFSSLGMTFFVINQYREKQDMFAPPEPPGGNFLRHKSHLTLYGKSLSKSKFFTKRPDAARSVLWTIQKARDAFVGVDFRLEMTQFSGFDAILSNIMMLKDLGILEKKRGPYKLSIPKTLVIKYTEIDGNEKEETLDMDDFMEENVSSSEELKFDSLVDLYNFFLTNDSIPFWKVMVKCGAVMMFRQHIFSDSDYIEFIKRLYNDIKICYFDGTKKLVDVLPTYIRFNG